MTMPEFYRSALRASERVDALQPFFVVGCQKSGTTWVQRLLDGHPQVCCNGEGHVADVLAPALRAALDAHNGQSKVTWTLDTRDLLSLLRLMTDRTLAAYLDARPDASAVTAVGDKTPEAALALPVLDALYPTAKFVNVIRDGRDAAVSGWAHLRRLGQADRFASFTEYAAYFADRHWAPYIVGARHAATKLADRYLEVRYESLHARPEEETRRLLRLLEVDDGDASVAACVEAGSFERLSGGRRRGEEEPTSHFRKGVVGDWRDHFEDEALRGFDAAAGDLLRELGYAEVEAASLRG